MKSKPDELKQKMDCFRAALQRRGVKATPQRALIFQEVAGLENHPDAVTIYKAVREKLPMVSLDTVYRNLWLLQDLGLIRILGARDRVRFDGNMKAHHHFVCKACGLMCDFYSSAFDRLKIPSAVKSLGAGEIIQVEIKGICVACSKKSKIKPAKISR
jgi:Fur family transcriptional regulator, peroxide stress response regulator